MSSFSGMNKSALEPDLKLLDPHSRFQTLRGLQGSLYFTGSGDVAWPLVLQLLEDAKFPDRIRGCFAFVYIPDDAKRAPILAVDHLSTIPLFYSDSYVSSNFSTIAAAVGDGSGSSQAFDRKFFWESQLFWGYTASERTVLQSVKRMQPGHYRRNGRSTRFIDLREEMGEAPLVLDEFRETLESVFLLNAGERNAMLVSGGTDSATLMAVVSKLGLKNRFKIVTVRSDVEVFSESSLIETLAKKIDLEVDYYSAKTIRIVREPKIQSPPSEMFLWKDYSFYYRKQAVVSVDRQGFDYVFTGECGDQLFGGPKLAKQIPFILQSRSWSARDLARQYLHLSMREAFGEWQGYKTSPLVEKYSKSDPEFNAVYEETIESIASFFDSLPTNDLINRLLAINLAFKGPYRMYHYSQDSYRYLHPFAQWSMVRLALRTRSSDKIYNGGRLKEAFYQAYRDRLINEIWEAPKTGTAIPTR